MKKTHIAFAVFIVAFVGCTDTIDTVTREYRNTNNEVVDALMMITDERSATRMKLRIFDQMLARYNTIDGHLKTVTDNRSRKEFVKEYYESDGLLLYKADLQVNQLRFNLESRRLQALVDQYVLIKQKELDAKGDRTPVNAQELCPNLWKVAKSLELMKPAIDQLYKPKLTEMEKNFDQWKLKEEELKGFQQKHKTRWENAFKPKDEILEPLRKATAGIQVKVE
jgi:hypothetical protein